MVQQNKIQTAIEGGRLSLRNPAPEIVFINEGQIIHHPDRDAGLQDIFPAAIDPVVIALAEVEPRLVASSRPAHATQNVGCVLRRQDDDSVHRLPQNFAVPEHRPKL